MTDDLNGVDTPIYGSEHGNITPTVGLTPSLHGLLTPASVYPITPSGAGFSPRMEG